MTGSSLRAAWDAEARNWIAWARRPDDSYWLFHRDAFLAGLPEPPARVVDVGCGEGRLPRDLQRLGYSVIGIDGSPTLVAAARQADPEGDYRVADVSKLPLEDACADLVTAFMSLHDVDDLDAALLEAARILIPGGHLRTAIVHPINSAGDFEAREHDSRFVIAGSYFDERRYSDLLERGGLEMTFASVHRSLERVIRAIVAAGLLIDHVAEIPDSTAPPGSRWQRIPLFLDLGAIKARA
jgi:SAM-dependent methyltransferase